MAWFFPFIFVASVAFQFSVAVTEVSFGPLDQMDSISGRIFHMLFLIALHLGLTFFVLPIVRIWTLGVFLGSVYLCHAWIFRGVRPPQRGGGFAPPGE